MVTTTGNVVIDLLHNFHLECGARIHKLRVYETMTEPTGREVCGYLLVRGSVHAHAYALALKKITGVAIEQMLPTPNINLDRIPECQRYLADGSHRRLYRFSPDDYSEIADIWTNGEVALPGDPPGELEVVDGAPEGGRIHDLMGDTRAFSPEYAPRQHLPGGGQAHQTTAQEPIEPGGPGSSMMLAWLQEADERIGNLRVHGGDLGESPDICRGRYLEVAKPAAQVPARHRA